MSLIITNQSREISALDKLRLAKDSYAVKHYYILVNFPKEERDKNKNLFPWLKDIYDHRDKKQIFNAVLLLYQEVNNLLMEKNFSMCDYLLKVIEIKRLSIELKIGVLRITYPARNNLSLWPNMLSRVREFLYQEERNAKKLLYGLTGD